MAHSKGLPFYKLKAKQAINKIFKRQNIRDYQNGAALKYNKIKR